MRSAFVFNCLAAVFGIHACVSILEHIVEPPVVSNCSPATLTCRVDAGVPNVEVWWTFQGENVSKLAGTTIVTDNADKGEWQLRLECPTPKHKGTYICNAQRKNESEAISHKEAILNIYHKPEVEFTNEPTVKNTGSITLHWRVKNDGNFPVTSFHLYSDSPDDESELEIPSYILGNTTTTHTIHGLLPGHTYTFKLAVYNEAYGESDYIYQNVSMPADVPPKVSWVHTLASTNETLLFGWRKPDYENGASITHYGVQLQRQNGSLYAEKTMTIGNSDRKNHMYIFLALQPVETYTFRVRACSDIGCGEWSEPLKATTSDGVPDPPRNVLLTCERDFERDAESITVTWDPPVNARGTILAYNVTLFTSVQYLNKENQTVEDKTSKTEIIDAEKYKMEFTNVYLPSTEISVTMSTINHSGCGPMTNITVNTQCKSPSNACDAILEHVAEPPVVNNCSAVTLICRVDNRLPNMEVWWTFKGENVSELLDTTIVTDKGEWQLQVKCPTSKHKGTYICNAQGRNENGNVCRKKAILKIYEAPVIEFTNETTLDFPNGVTLHWTVTNDGNLPVTRFQLYRYSSVDRKSIEVDYISGNITKYTFNDLLPGLTYSFKLVAFNDVGESYSVYWNATMPVPLKVYVVKVFFPSNNSLIFGWYPPSYNNGVNITHYNIQLHHPNGSIVAEETVIGKQLQKFGNLEPSKAYTFQVQACDILGCGDWSDPIEGRTTND